MQNITSIYDEQNAYFYGEISYLVQYKFNKPKDRNLLKSFMDGYNEAKQFGKVEENVYV